VTSSLNGNLPSGTTEPQGLGRQGIEFLAPKALIDIELALLYMPGRYSMLSALASVHW